ncbi:MAG: tetratricopeptide repeat protein, partial [Arenicellales bacterium]|nr:tetratricopeptide repeat protein [Arenicellales bacterium]
MLLSLAPVGVHAQSEDLERAVNAYNSGDYATAVSLWQFHARQGNREAQYAMGVAYHEGNGVSRDLEKALSWFRQAAESGHPIAMFNLGVARWEGRGVKQSFARAVDWWEQAAGQNHA